MLLPKSQSPPLLQVMSQTDSGLQIRHSKSDPMIRNNSMRNGCKLFSEVNTKLNPMDETLLYPHWISTSNTSLATLESAHEDSIYEMVTLEGLRSLYNSCFECGVSWHKNHVTLDCTECGGYSMSRPCPECDGKCDSQWERNLIATHENHKAIWTGVCKIGQTSPLRDTSNSQPNFKASLKS